jgi:hypothetical protein
MEDAAQNEGGSGQAFGLGLGMAAGQQAVNSLNTPSPAAPAAPPAGPPPLPSQAQWFVGVGSERQGPFDLNGLGAQVAAGTVTPASLVWKTGMTGWVPAGEVPDLQGVFAAVPPPLPPQG